MRVLTTIFAPMLGWLAFTLFRLPAFKQSRFKHKVVMKLFRYAAEMGSRKALSVYGHLLFFRGEGISSRVQGAIYLERAAEKGDIKATYQMARIYEDGFHEFPANEPKAFAYYLIAAEAGHILALRRMVDIYLNGELEQPCSDEKARYWEGLLDTSRPGQQAH